jgi:methylenetetrahydrofolate dehydrogenase (NADP+) / methenyltetrahydrofolate cyclohydrolase
MVESVHGPTNHIFGEPAAGPLLRGKVAVVIGASDVVGKPIAVMLMRHEATVISCNKWTPEMPAYARSADVLVAAAGVPGLITAELVKHGATVIDVGVNRITVTDLQTGEKKTKTVGDVAFEQVSKVAGHISPVPGGVGPVTVAMLLLNVVESAERRT